MKRQTKQKVPRLSRRELENLLPDLVQRIDRHRIELEAIQHTYAPDGSHLTVEYYARTAFRIAIEHQAARVRDIERFAKIIHEQSYGGAART